MSFTVIITRIEAQVLTRTDRPTKLRFSLRRPVLSCCGLYMYRTVKEVLLKPQELDYEGRPLYVVQEWWEGQEGAWFRGLHEGDVLKVELLCGRKVLGVVKVEDSHMLWKAAGGRCSTYQRFTASRTLASATLDYDFLDDLLLFEDELDDSSVSEAETETARGLKKKLKSAVSAFRMGVRKCLKLN